MVLLWYRGFRHPRLLRPVPFSRRASPSLKRSENDRFTEETPGVAAMSAILDQALGSVFEARATSHRMEQKAKLV